MSHRLRDVSWDSDRADGCAVDGCAVDGCAADGCAADGCAVDGCEEALRLGVGRILMAKQASSSARAAFISNISSKNLAPLNCKIRKSTIVDKRPSPMAIATKISGG